jgi:hypothetical protein
VAMGWSQESGKGPQVSVRVPAGASVDDIQMTYFMSGPFGGYGSSILPTPKAQRYVFDAAVDGVAAKKVQAVVYMPGCELSRFEIAMHGESVERQVECRVLSQWPLSGRVVMDQALARRSSSLEIEVVYEAYWVSGFFGITDGPVTMFRVATVPIGEDGSFLARLPIFALDPAEKTAVEGHRGEFGLRLREKKTWNIVGTLRSSEFATSSGGLELRTQYPGLEFVVEHGGTPSSTAPIE